ncbi:dihydrodipicolinate reductase [Actinomadura bangladeshensis]|uniref:Dihydrodipicolinate reductase n=1 Tax=Actinomadura bangladeshensis TaxID=453573 RepID=A0A4R4P2W3_9ACTN|nr:dihydrodipicolinate reductase [Actinomadura bangladeshensis]TDC16229.1 dihydrodipicolinate reductase [Actinomadura bangladeshensis]
MSYLVGYWAAGAVDGRTLRALIGHPDLELAGVVTGAPRQEGVDAAELAGTGRPLGILAAGDPAGLLARRPHVVCHTGGSIDDLCRALEAGAGVVSTGPPALLDPPSADPAVVRRLRAACATGGAACLALGTGPAGDVLPALLSGGCGRVEAIRITEFRRVGTQAAARFGLGAPIGRRPPIVRPGAPVRRWGPVVRLLARHLAVPLDDLTETHEVCAAPEEIDGPAGRIAKGALAGLRFQVSGVLRGRPVITVDRVVRARADLAPHWPAPPFGAEDGHRVEIAGEPAVRMDLAGGRATAHRTAGAVPAAAEAPPGLHTPLTLPVVTGRRLLR